MRFIKFNFFLLAVVMTGCSVAQPNISSLKTKETVQKVDWSQRGLVLTPDFFDGKDEEFIQQIGKDEFEKVKKYANIHGWPKELQYNLFDRTDTIWIRKVQQNFERLNSYVFASFRNITKEADNGIYYLLRADFKDNLFLDSTSTQAGAVYIIIPQSAVMISKKN